MPLQKQLLRVPLTAGLQEKEDSRSLALNGAATMKNCVMAKNGAVRARLGNAALTKSINLGVGGDVITSAVAGGQYKTSMWLAGAIASIAGFGGDQPALYSYSPAVQEWQPADVLPDGVALDRIGIVATVNQLTDVDQCYCNGLLVVVCNGDPYNLGYHQPYFTILDPATNAVLAQTAPVDSSIAISVVAPKLTAVGTTVMLTLVASSSIVAYTLDATNYGLGWSTGVTMQTDGAGSISSGVYDVAPVPGTAQFLIGYQVSHAGDVVVLKLVALGGTPGAPTFTPVQVQYDESAATSIAGIAVAYTAGEYAWAAYTATDGSAQVVRAWGWETAAPATHSGPYSLYTFGGGTDSPGRIAIAHVNPTYMQVYWSPALDTSQPDGVMLSRAYVASYLLIQAVGPSPSPIHYTYGAMLASKVVVIGDAAYLGVQTPSADQGTTFLCRDDVFGVVGDSFARPLRAVATLDPRLAKFFGNICPDSQLGQVCTSLPVYTSLGASVVGLLGYANTNPNRTALYAYPIDLASDNRYAATELGELAGIAGGVPCFYDGNGVVEMEFLQYPQSVSATYHSSTSSGGLSTGAYQYIAVYEWYDARGQVHRSATSPPVTVTATADTTSSTTVWSAIGLTQRLPFGLLASTNLNLFAAKLPGTLVVYRTQANGTVFYRCTADPAPSTSFLTFTQGTITFADTTMTDTELAVQPELYTTGGALDNYCPPSARCMVQHNRRHWLAGGAEPTAIWPSKELTDGEAPGFNEDQNFAASGAVRALASMDDKLVIFVRRGSRYGIEYITGEGPTDAGTQSDWTPPQAIPSEAGATHQRGVCSGPFGVLFHSISGGPTGTGGIYLLGRDLSVQYLSGPVEDTIAANPYVSAMVLHPTLGRVYISLTPSATSKASGARLVWDYEQGGVWSLDTLYDPDTSAASAGAQHAWLAGSAYSWVTPSGRVHQETQASYADAGHFVPMTYTTAFVSPTEGGFARFWNVYVEMDVLETAAPPNVAMLLTYDNSESYAEPWSWTGAQLAAGNRFPVVDAQLTPGNQKAKSIQLQVAVTAPTSWTTGQGLSIGGIVLELGVKSGGYRNIPAALRG